MITTELLKELSSLSKGQLAALLYFTENQELVLEGPCATGKTHLGIFLLDHLPGTKMVVGTSAALDRRNIIDHLKNPTPHYQPIGHLEREKVAGLQVDFLLMEGLTIREAVKALRMINPKSYMLIPYLTNIRLTLDDQRKCLPGAS